jgi:hypothetical protein
MLETLIFYPASTTLQGIVFKLDVLPEYHEKDPRF